MKPATLSFRSFQNVLFIILAIHLFIQKASAQSPCDSLYIESVQYQATDADYIAVTVFNENTGWFFNYPQFMLFDQNGDTLATETVGFFGIGMGYQTHHMDVRSDATIPQGPFSATIELHTDFGDSLQCSWQQIVELCPPDSCTMAEIYLTNLDTLQEGTVYWYLTDLNNTIWESGEIEMDLITHTHFDTICLPPGEYELSVSPFSDIWIDEGFVLGVTESYNQSIGTNTAQQNDSTPQNLFFNWFEDCVPSPNSIEELNTTPFSVFQQYGDLVISSLDNGPIGQIQLLDLHGRSLKNVNVNTNNFRMNVNVISSGIYIVLNKKDNNSISVQRVLIH